MIWQLKEAMADEFPFLNCGLIIIMGGVCQDPGPNELLYDRKNKKAKELTPPQATLYYW
jgi:hypothetical protein